MSVAAAELAAAFPPRLSHSHKQLLYDLACPAGSAHAGEVTVSRWRAPALHKLVVESHRAAIERRDGYFVYDPPRAGEATEHWHVNFADPHLFTAYGSRLFAQDEMQVAEHPALGSVAEAMRAGAWGGKMAPLTVEGGEPTPVLVRGVERRCRVATDPDPGAGRPYGLYGKRFASAPADAIERAVVRLDPPTVSNIIAIAAPGYGEGTYSAAEIENILRTAVTGFAAARDETGGPVTVHTGFWGCGAFGGNRVLMTGLQIVAAHLAEVARLVYWTGTNPADATAFADGRGLAERLLDRASSTRAVVARAVEAGCVWGTSDGN